MLYHLFQYLQEHERFPGSGLFGYISFRTALAFLGSVIISAIFGKRIIRMLQRKQVGEEIRNLGLAGQIEKRGTPTMGGLIILSGLFIPVLLFARIENVYIWLPMVSAVWLGVIGFLDDYIKVFKKNKKGLAGKFKVIGQIGLGLIVGITLHLHKDVVIREKMTRQEVHQLQQQGEKITIVNNGHTTGDTVLADVRSLKTTIPFVKDNELDYERLLTFLGDKYTEYGWILYVLVVILIITAVSNGANITDGLDGLAAGVSIIIIATLGLFAYVSGNSIFADYLNIMYIPNLGELVIFSGALMGACVGFLWYNAYPAQVFMGDTGSLTLGGLIAVMALMVRKELLIPVLCGIFLVENLSVLIQVSYFKYTKRKYGEGRRIFLMSPLHHHYQKLEYHEAKIVTRFWIVAVFLAILTIITLKIR